MLIQLTRLVEAYFYALVGFLISKFTKSLLLSFLLKNKLPSMMNKARQLYYLYLILLKILVVHICLYFISFFSAVYAHHKTDTVACLVTTQSICFETSINNFSKKTTCPILAFN